MKNTFLLIFALLTYSWTNGETIEKQAINNQEEGLAQAREYMSSQKAAFEENKGQVTGQDAIKVKYTYKNKGLSIFLMDNALAYQFSKTHYPEGYKPLDKFATPQEHEQMEVLAKDIRVETYRMDVSLIGANSNAMVTSQGKSHDYTQYHKHNALNVHNYSKITYHNVYPNIDWVIYTTEENIKYDFVVRPGGNPAQIQLQTRWVEDLTLSQNGNLTLKNRMGTITEQSPMSLQGEKTINTHFKVEGNTISFQLSPYNPSQTLIIDPALQWATYYGGSDWDEGYSCTVDDSGNVYLAGLAGSTTAIASGGYQNSLGGGGGDAFIVKFNAAGIRLWATYYGGTNADIGHSCAVDGAGNVYLAGLTGSTSAIASGGFQNTHGGTFDAFLVKFNAAGIRQWATYYGGSGDDRGHSCAVDGAGNVYLAGETESLSAITSGGHQNNYGGGSDVFLVKFNMDGVRQWGTYYGGNGDDNSWSCAVDGAGNVYLAGETGSTSAIAYGGHQNTHGGGAYDAFIVKFNAAGIRQWGTYYGGGGDDNSNSCVVDGSGNVYIAGETASTNAIASGGFQNTFGGYSDAFIVKFNASGIRQWGTYYGGSSNDLGYCAADGAGNVYLAGGTKSTSAIADGGFQDTIGGYQDAFIVKFNAAGTRLWGTYYGGSAWDAGNSCAVDGAGNVYIAGETSSITGIASGGFQNTYGGYYDAFIVKFEDTICAPTVSITANMANLEATPGFASYLWYLDNVIITGANSNTLTATSNGVYQVEVTDANGCKNTATYTYNGSSTGIESPNPVNFLSLYPNPAQNKLTLSFGESGKRTLQVYDGFGKLVLQTQTTGQQETISLHNLAGGVYQVKITQGGGFVTQRLVVER